MNNRLDLKHPVTVDGLRIEHLEMRRPKVRDMKAANSTTASAEESEIRLFANLCEVSPDTIEEMDLGDYKRLQKVFEGFLSG